MMKIERKVARNTKNIFRIYEPIGLMQANALIFAYYLNTFLINFDTREFDFNLYLKLSQEL